jgi:hypothetical protein
VLIGRAGGKGLDERALSDWFAPGSIGPPAVAA